MEESPHTSELFQSESHPSIISDIQRQLGCSRRRTHLILTMVQSLSHLGRDTQNPNVLLTPTIRVPIGSILIGTNLATFRKVEISLHDSPIQFNINNNTCDVTAIIAGIINIEEQKSIFRLGLYIISDGILNETFSYIDPDMYQAFTDNGFTQSTDFLTPKIMGRKQLWISRHVARDLIFRSLMMACVRNRVMTSGEIKEINIQWRRSDFKNLLVVLSARILSGLKHLKFILSNIRI